MLVSAAALGQPNPLATGSEQVRVIQRDRDYQVIERVTRESLGGGTVVLKTNSYTVLGTGISYWRDNQWKDSNPRFSLAPGLALADQGLFQLTLTSDIAAEGAVEWVTPDSKRFVTHGFGVWKDDRRMGPGGDRWVGNSMPKPDPGM